MTFDQGRRHRGRPHLPAWGEVRARRLFRILAGITCLGLLWGAASALAGPGPGTLGSGATPGGASRDAGATILPGTPLRGAEPPAGLADLTGWLEYQARNHISALPEEARLFYRKGLLLHQSGVDDEAVRQVRGASILDPAYVEPHLTLASWFLLRDPSQALLQYAAVLELARQNFILQLVLVANALYMGLQALLIGLLAAAFLLVWVHQRELRHGWQERLSGFISPVTARWWSWGFLVLPFVAGFGVALPTIVFLAYLWPSLRASGRTLLVALVLILGAMPWMTDSLGRLANPLREDRAPYWGVALLENEPFSPARRDALARLAEAQPKNAFVQFGLGWISRRGGDLVTAEAAYRRALAMWPQDDRVMNDLGNTLAMEGRTDEALEYYRRATQANPSNAAAWFNTSQIHTQRFDYRPATDALSRASALNFEMVRNYQSSATNDGALPLVDQWLAPRTFWSRLAVGPALLPVAPALPPTWRGRIECAGLPFTALLLVLVPLALAVGLWQHRSIPLRNCSNCGQVVCRRCAQRRRELALCPACVAVEARAESPDFARVLLLQHCRGITAQQNLLRTAFATLIPGYGLLALRSVFAPVVLLIAAAALAARTLGATTAFTYEPRLSLANGDVPMPVQIGLWALLYGVSLASYFARAARAGKQAASTTSSVRGRSIPPSRRSHVAAA